LSLERRMKCGIGKCQHCTCGEKYACIDGPVFSYNQIKENFEGTSRGDGTLFLVRESNILTAQKEVLKTLT